MIHRHCGRNHSGIIPYNNFKLKIYLFTFPQLNLLFIYLLLKHNTLLTINIIMLIEKASI